MTDSPVQFALREWRGAIGRPATMAVMAGAALVLALAGPFGTSALLPVWALFLYWIVLVVLTYSAGILTDALLRPRLRNRQPWLRYAVPGLITSALVLGLVSGLNALFFGYAPRGSEFVGFATTTFAIAFIVTVIVTSLTQRAVEAQEGTKRAMLKEAPALLNRMPLDKRGSLVSISVEDHYVSIRTDRGAEMVLMRLSDAIREVGDTPGAQVHRSHWVAWDAVTAARRDGDRAILSLRHGPDIPVSRANLGKIREAGLLPR